MNRQPIEDLVAETGKTIDAPPPEILETDPGLSPEEVEQIRRNYLLKRFWISAKGFWGATGGRFAWVLTGGLLVLIFLQLSFQYGVNLWNRAIFDAIETRDAAVVLHLTAVFFPLAIGSVLLGVIQVYTRMGIQRRWRAWLTSSVISRWLKNGRYYQLNLVSGDHQNPEYRIAEDLRVATDAPVDFATGGNIRVPVGNDIHHRTLDDRRCVDADNCRRHCDDSSLSRRSGSAVCSDRERLDGRYRAKFRGHFGKQESD
ncbi:hypothetical protein ABIF93_007748 [Bradyrhizobium japonicum]